jgi:hypothetical protein
MPTAHWRDDGDLVDRPTVVAIGQSQDRLEIIERALEHLFASTWGARQTS